jgi:predicted ATP-grasp superfamily ATP-dependent carboligase
MRVLVTDAARGSAISVIRSLGRRGIEVVAADSNVRSPGFFSRYTSARVIHSDLKSDTGGAIRDLARAAREHRIDLLIPVSEDSVALLSEEREAFQGDVKLALPDRDGLQVTRDKLGTLDLATRLGIPVPRTALVESASEAVRSADSLGWPIVLKPQVSRALREEGRLDAFQVTYATDTRSLIERMRRFEHRCPVLLQEYHQGEGHGVGLLMRSGRPVLAFQHRRLREVPTTGGSSSFRESVRLDPALYDYSLRLLGALDWTGVAMVEFKLTPDGPQLMEINGRIWGSLPLAVKSGVDFPAHLADLYLGNGGDSTTAPITSYSVGVRSRDFNLELVWIAKVLFAKRQYPFLENPRRLQALPVALRLLDPRDGFDAFDVEDVRPGLAEIAHIAATIPTRLAARSRRDGLRV